MTDQRSRGAGPSIRADGTLRPDPFRDDPETGCRIWLKSMSRSSANISDGLPQAWNGHRTVRVRHELWRIHRGTVLTIGAGARCGNSRCVALAHLHDGHTSASLSLDDFVEIDALANKLAVTEIAKRLGVTAAVVEGHLKRGGVLHRDHGAWHPAAKRFAGRDLPPQPATVDDRQWGIFSYACEHSYVRTGQHFGMTKQNVLHIVKQVLLAIDVDKCHE